MARGSNGGNIADLQFRLIGHRYHASSSLLLLQDISNIFCVCQCQYSRHSLSSLPRLSFQPFVSEIIMLVIMRSIIFLASIVSFALACGNPDTDACASVFTVSSADAATFCATYTTASVTHTTDLPAYATYCSMKPKKLSSACSCLVAQTTLQTITATSTAASGVSRLGCR